MDKWAKRLILGSLGLALGYKGARFVGRKIFEDISKDSLKTVMTDLYDENIWELISATTRFTPQIIAETNMRAQEGKVIQRPLGPPKKFPSLDQLMFSIGQFHVMPTPLEEPVDTKVIIGKQCARPLEIDLPIMISAMAYGEALSEGVKVAIAKGATMSGTATNGGEGPFLASERKAAQKFILQYNRGHWSKSPEILRQADAIEIQFGQGAIGGVGHKMDSSKIDSTLRKGFGLLPFQDAVAHSRQPEVNHPSEIGKLVKKLKGITGDIPIGVKMGAGKYLEKDLEWAINGGVDFITIEGGDGATKGSAPILQDDFGVPSIYAIKRSADFLRKNGVQDKVSLISVGKMRTPGDVLKALALGADATYIGAIALFAVAHTQVLNALPLEPPTQAVWYDGKYADEFEVKRGAESLYKFLMSCKEEIVEGVRALGKTSIQQVDREDLFALDETTARGTGVTMCYEPYEPVNSKTVPPPTTN